MTEREAMFAAERELARRQVEREAKERMDALVRGAHLSKPEQDREAM